MIYMFMLVAFPDTCAIYMYMYMYTYMYVWHR